MLSIRTTTSLYTWLRSCGLTKGPYRRGLLVALSLALSVWMYTSLSVYLVTGYHDHCLSVNPDLVIPHDLQLQQMSDQKLSCLFQRYVTSLQKLCSEPKRFGNVDYGGVRICADDGVAPSEGCVMYSYNHDLSDRFIQQIHAKYRCSVVFYGDDLQLRKKSNILGFNQIVNTHVNELSVLILKIKPSDVQFLLEFSLSVEKSHIKQIILEIHFESGQERREDYVSILRALRELYSAGYEIYWFDRNWEFVEYQRKNRRKAKCFTINMLRRHTSTSKGNKTVSETTSIDLPMVAPFGTKSLPKEDVLRYQEEYAKYITKHQILCKQMLRLGNIVDGGWDICHDAQFRPKSQCTVYSIGISWDFSFDEDMERTYGCDVFSFDPSMNTDDFQRSEHIKFYNVGLGDKVTEIEVKGSKWKIKNLKTIMAELGHTNKRIDVLKIDIEGHERQSLPEIIESGALKNVVQLCMETHSYFDLGAMRKLHELGFRVFWAHQNPWAPMYTNDETLSYGMEVYFVNTNFIN